MNARIIVVTASLVGLVVFAACGDRSTPTPLSPYEGYLTVVTPPCEHEHEHDGPDTTIDPCAPGAPPQVPGAADSRWEPGDAPETIADVLGGNRLFERGPRFVPHVVVRGTYMTGTERCTWPHSWRTPSSLVEPSVEGALIIKCFADVRVHEYILGTGPEQITTEVLLYGALIAEQGHIEMLTAYFEGLLVESESGLGGIMGREMVLFLAPPIEYSVGAWDSTPWIAYDVQRQEDGTVVAFHPERGLWKSRRPEDYAKYRDQLEMTLPALKQAVTAAHEARVAKFGGRIGVDESLPMLVSDVHGLRDFMVSVVEYEDGGPAPPPPVPGGNDPGPICSGPVPRMYSCSVIGVDDDDATPTPTPPGGS